MMQRGRPARLRGLVAAMCGTALTAALAVTGAAPASAASTSVGPVPLHAGAGPDSLVVLMAASAERAAGITVRWPDAAPKHFWVDGVDGPDRTLRWTVTAPRAADYHVAALVSAKAGRRFRLSVEQTGQTLGFSTPVSDWDKIEAGTIPLPKGTATLRLETTDAPSGDSASVKSLELMRAQDRANYLDRVKNFKGLGKATRVRMSQAGYGLMFQYGPWSYPRTGPKPALNDHAAAFDVDAFADMVQQTGAKYVIWSASWWTYELAAPSNAIDAILGNGNRTATRDLIGEIARELKSRGLMFFLYYHTGQDSHLGYESTDWWRAQQFPAEFPETGGGDRSTFFRNWQAVISELGERYGRDLDGWFFDDGLVYYPAPFERLARAARAGNPRRLVSWNPWIAPRYTDFQDVSFGEGCLGEPGAGSAPMGGDGVFTSGPQAGLLEHCMFRLEDDWGVRSEGQQIGAPNYSPERLACAVRSASARHVPLSINLMMWFPGQPAQPSLDTLARMRQLLDDPGFGAGDQCSQPDTCPATLINDDDPSIHYEGVWGRATGRSGAGDHCEDVSYTQRDGDSATVTFSGTGIDVLGPVDGTVAADVYLDGQLVAQPTLSSGGYAPQQVLYSARDLPAGMHTVRLVKRGGPYLQIDAYRLIGGA
jgi:hypothetical protein